MRATLYGIPGCPHTVVGALMLEAKRVPYRRVDLPTGLHRPLLRHLLGFDADTVPALRFRGEKLQETRVISRALDRLVPGAPVLVCGAMTEAAEEWAELALRPLKRALVREVLRAPGAPARASIPSLLAHLHGLMTTGVLGGPQPTSADVHAAVLVRLMSCFQRLPRRDPAVELADRLCPVERYPGHVALLTPMGGPAGPGS